MAKITKAQIAQIENTYPDQAADLIEKFAADSTGIEQILGAKPATVDLINQILADGSAGVAVVKKDLPKIEEVVKDIWDYIRSIGKHMSKQKQADAVHAAVHGVAVQGLVQNPDNLKGAALSDAVAAEVTKQA